LNDEGFFSEEFCEAHALIQICGFDDENGERSRIFKIRFELFNGFFAFFVAEGFDCFGVLEKDELLWREHGERLRLVNGGLDFVAIGGKTRDGPGAGGFGDEAFNELRTAGVAR